MAIDDQGGAQRLARAILADVLRYNQAKLASGGDPRSALEGELGEGRELFRSRVVPALHAVFERELATFDFARPAKRGPGIAVVAILAILAILSGAVLVSYLF